MEVSRRDFLRLIGVGLGAAAAGRLAGLFNPPQPDNLKDHTAPENEYLPSLYGFKREPSIDVPERQIVGYINGDVQARVYAEAVSYVWVPDKKNTEIVEKAVPPKIREWLGREMSILPKEGAWVKHLNIEKASVNLTPEPLEGKLMLAISW